MKKKRINYFDIASTKLSLNLAHTSNVKTPKNQARQISTAFHEATHFVIEITHRCSPCSVNVNNSAKSLNYYGVMAQGSCFTIDEGGFSLVESFLAAGFYEMVLGNENTCNFEVSQAEEEYKDYQREQAVTHAFDSTSLLLNAGDKVIGIWPLIYVCALAFLRYRRKSPRGPVPIWVLHELESLILAMLNGATVTGIKDGQEVDLDFDYFDKLTPKMLDCILWLQKHIGHIQDVTYREILKDFTYEMTLHNSRFTETSYLNIKNKVDAYLT